MKANRVDGHGEEVTAALVLCNCEEGEVEALPHQERDRRSCGGRGWGTAAGVAVALALPFVVVVMVQQQGPATAAGRSGSPKGFTILEEERTPDLQDFLDDVGGAGEEGRMPERVDFFLGSLMAEGTARKKVSLPNVADLLTQLEPSSLPEALKSCLEIVAPKKKKGVDTEVEREAPDVKGCLLALGVNGQEDLPDVQGFLESVAKTGGVRKNQGTAEKDRAAFVTGILLGHRLEVAESDDQVGAAEVVKATLSALAGLSAEQQGEMPDLGLLLGDEEKGSGIGQRGSFELGIWMGVSSPPAAAASADGGEAEEPEEEEEDGEAASLEEELNN